MAPCVASADLQKDMVLWYRQPAARWNEAMPLGNGLIGAMVFGDARHERIALNESSFWSGRPHDYNDPAAIKYFPQIRDLVFAGKFQEAEQMANAHFWGVPGVAAMLRAPGRPDARLRRATRRSRITAANWTWKPA